jgi:hypothetical protein
VKRVKLVVATAVIATVVAVAFIVFIGVSNAEARSKCNTTACHMRVTIKPHRAWLARLRECESGDSNARAYHRGYYQFTWETWRAAGGEGDPADASKTEQGFRVVKWARKIGWDNVRTTAGWPNCG